MTGLESVLLAIAASLSSGAISSAARTAWHGLRDTLWRTADGDPKAEAWIRVFDVDPTLENAAQVAKRFEQLGRDQDREVQQVVVQAQGLLASGPGAASAVVGTNSGSIGGIHNHSHLHFGNDAPVEWRQHGPSLHEVVNASDDSIVIRSITGEGLSRLHVPVELPITLRPGESVSVIAEVPLGSPRPLLRAELEGQGVRTTSSRALPPVVAKGRSW